MIRSRQTAATFCVFLLLGMGRPVAGYSQVQELKIGPHTYELQYTVGDEQSDVFFQTVSSAAFSDDGTVVITDSRSPIVVAFDKQGNPLWTVDDAGEGPGQLNRPFVTGIRKGNVLIANQNGTRVDYYSMKGAFVSSRSYSDFGMDQAGFCGWLDDDLAVLTRPMNAAYGSHLFIVDWEAGTILKDREFRLPGVDDPPRGFNIGSGCEVVDGSIMISHAYTDAAWLLDSNLNDIGYVEGSEGNFYPPVLTRFDNGNLSAMFPIDVELNVIEERFALTNIQWPCKLQSVEAYQAAAKAGDTIPKCRTQRLLHADGSLVQEVFSGSREEASFTFVRASSNGWLAVQPDIDYPMVAVYRRVDR